MNRSDQYVRAVVITGSRTVAGARQLPTSDNEIHAHRVVHEWRWSNGGGRISRSSSAAPRRRCRGGPKPARPVALRVGRLSTAPAPRPHRWVTAHVEDVDLDDVHALQPADASPVVGEPEPRSTPDRDPSQGSPSSPRSRSAKAARTGRPLACRTRPRPPLEVLDHSPVLGQGGEPATHDFEGCGTEQ
jgi:hypothetical protein